MVKIGNKTMAKYAYNSQETKAKQRWIILKTKVPRKPNTIGNVVIFGSSLSASQSLMSKGMVRPKIKKNIPAESKANLTGGMC